MKFLEAKKILRARNADNLSTLHLLCSSQSENLSPYLEASAANTGVDIQIERIAFGTLTQSLLNNNQKSDSDRFYRKDNTAILLYPWDFCPQLDWRLYNPENEFELSTLLDQIESFSALLSESGLNGVYINAPLAPMLKDINEQNLIQARILSSVYAMQISVTSADVFSVDNFVQSGMGVANAHAPSVAHQLWQGVYTQCVLTPQKKVIITDLDNTAWQGIVGEDGPTGVKCLPTGSSKLHYFYQLVLKKLKNSGAILGVVSKNDMDLATKPFVENEFALSLLDFASFKCGYGIKSQMIKDMAVELNLPLDSIIFIDDNPIEIAEVKACLPQVQCELFPQNFSGLPALTNKLHKAFSTKNVTNEDNRRTQLYQIRKQSEQAQTQYQSVEDFLLSLNMLLTVNEYTHNIKDATRAIQLINKTNQFNLNGNRLTENDIKLILDKGGKLFSASLKDNYGDHGEVVACLLDSSNYVISFVMSCRVLQRQVEYRFILWLVHRFNLSSISFNFKKTSRNTPIQQFLSTLGMHAELSNINDDKSQYLTVNTNSINNTLNASNPYFTVGKAN